MTQSKILLIYTGGTIGMETNPDNGSLVPLPFEKLISYVPELEKLNCELDHVAFENPVDSSDASPEFWNDIARIIENKYEAYHGFVILHGTDTMAYTASALSFMLKGLAKPVVLTGSQLPMGSLRTDGRENLISAIEVAAAKRKGESLLQEVAVYFEYSLYRGNRSHKFSTEHFDAIISPNYPHLAEAGVHLNWDFNALLRRSDKPQQFRVNYYWSNDLSIIKIFPGISIEQIKHALTQPGISVFILETFGSGNLRMDEQLLELIRNEINNGKVIINLSQCRKGKVDQETYASGLRLAKLGVLSAKDMTLESTVVKSMYLLGNSANAKEFSTAFSKDISGELT